MLITTIVSTGSHPSFPPTGAADNGSFREKRKDLWRLVICSFFLHPSPHHFFCRRTEGRKRRSWVLSCHHRDTEAGKCLAPPGTKFPLCACALSRFSGVRLFAILWMGARQAPLSMGFSRQEHWSGFPYPPPGDLPIPGIV